MNSTPGENGAEQLLRLALKVISGAQGALESVLAPGGIVETVAIQVAGIIDDVAASRPEVRDNLVAAAEAFGRAATALLHPDQTTAPSSSESLPLDLATNVTNPQMNAATAPGAAHPGAE